MIKILKCSEVPREAIFERTLPTAKVEGIVADIIANVRENGDKALLAYTEKFDGVKLDALQVTSEEIEEALTLVSPEFLEILEKAAVNIRAFHEKQKRDGFEMKKEQGIILG